ncbi:MAG: hypothetical protein IH856_18075, partial [Deltaproteobacteria bacterium]|nr:hypothetical protein [Deltaproteobacteria bacterium]
MRILRSIIGTFVSLSLLLGLALSPAFAQPAFDPPGLARAIEAQERHTNDLLGIQGVVGTAVGLGTNGQAVVKIYTEKSGIGGLPRSLDGVPVVVQVTGKIHALHHRPGHSGGPGGGGGGYYGVTSEPAPTDRWLRPVPIGVSTGNAGECSAGTIGARVTDGPNVYALSNNHVYALENEAPDNSSILQPGRFDTNCASDNSDVIGTLEAFVPIDFSTLASNTVDAAIALSSTEDLGNSTPADGYGTPKSLLVTAFVGQSVQKYGRTTSLTKGVITGINATVNIGYSSGTARFVDQI